ncbi:hypothetical protein JB92DRAFT_1336473 [Gautieria morchelliformis]|nr:hypothetical protein JB92DRAFT_1336473 [Gautieria morchelliformis]
MADCLQRGPLVVIAVGKADRRTGGYSDPQHEGMVSAEHCVAAGLSSDTTTHTTYTSWRIRGCCASCRASARRSVLTLPPHRRGVRIPHQGCPNIRGLHASGDILIRLLDGVDVLRRRTGGHVLRRVSANGSVDPAVCARVLLLDGRVLWRISAQLTRCSPRSCMGSSCTSSCSMARWPFPNGTLQPHCTTQRAEVVFNSD